MLNYLRAGPLKCDQGSEIEYRLWSAREAFLRRNTLKGTPGRMSRKEDFKGADDANDRRIVSALRVLKQFMDTHSRQLLKHKDVTVPQAVCLEGLVSKGQMTVGALARHICLSPGTTVGIIDRLERKKMLRRIPDRNDRRSVQVMITDAGRDFYNATPHLLHDKLHQKLSSLPRERVESIADSLDLLVKLLKNDKSDA